jgi:hypothetical protein
MVDLVIVWLILCDHVAVVVTRLEDVFAWVDEYFEFCANSDFEGDEGEVEFVI